MIDKARQEISGNYACVVYTPNGQVKEIVYINVRPDGDVNMRERPTINSPNQKYTNVRVGSQFVLECIARGNPLPSIRIETPTRMILQDPARFELARDGTQVIKYSNRYISIFKTR